MEIKKIPKKPGNLKKDGQKFWKQVLREYTLEDAHDLERLLLACKCLDNLNEAEKWIKKDGMFVTNRYSSLVEHPAMKTVKDIRLLFVKIIKEIGLDLTTAEPKR